MLDQPGSLNGSTRRHTINMTQSHAIGNPSDTVVYLDYFFALYRKNDEAKLVSFARSVHGARDRERIGEAEPVTRPRSSCQYRCHFEGKLPAGSRSRHIATRSFHHSNSMLIAITGASNSAYAGIA